MSDEEKKAIDYFRNKIGDFELFYGKKITTQENEYLKILLNIIEKQSKEIEELKASHITTNNKATNTEKAKIFDVIENSIDTYIEKSKPYWEQIMAKDEMTIDEALTIIDDMYQDRYKIMSQKTEKETIVDLGKMDYIKFTNLEWASVRTLREVQSLNYELEKLQDKIKAKQKEIEKLKYKVREHICIEAHEQVKQLYVSKDKIKAKIEEVQNMKAKAKDIIVFKSSLNYIETELKSLLEKE